MVKNKANDGGAAWAEILARNVRVAYTFGEAAESIPCSVRFLQKQVKAGRLKVVRLSPRCVRIRPSDLAAYLDANAV